jgi:hypothetical protein
MIGTFKSIEFKFFLMMLSSNPSDEDDYNSMIKISIYYEDH